MSARHSDKRSTPDGAEPSAERERADRVEAELSRRGVPPGLARQLADLVGNLGPGAAETMRAAASVAAAGARLPASPGAEERATAPDVEEIGRLMAGFVCELEKLDEALQLLAAYLTRLRDKSIPPGRVLH